LATPEAAAAPVADMSEVLRVRDLVVSYGAVSALRGVSLHVGRGEVVALLGANGAGKSTMLRTISGLMLPKSGEIRFLGQRIDGTPPARIVRRGLAHSPEGRRLFGSLTVAENLRLGASTRSDRSGIEADRERLYALFPVLKERARQQAATLSGGEQQMVALARALVARPKLLLLDEPSLGIAPIIMQQIFASLAELKSSGVTMLLVEQNMSMALDLADRAYVLRTGKVSLEGGARELKTNYEEVAAAYLGASR
jgi:branched-chain amino acid transport system ATP-binding protein